MYGRRIYGLCISAQLLETAALRRETWLAAPDKAAGHSLLDWTAACVCSRWDKAAAQVRANSWGVRDKLGPSAAQMSGAAVSRIGGSRIYTGPVL